MASDRLGNLSTRNFQVLNENINTSNCLLTSVFAKFSLIICVTSSFSLKGLYIRHLSRIGNRGLYSDFRQIIRCQYYFPDWKRTSAGHLRKKERKKRQIKSIPLGDILHFMATVKAK